MKTRLAEFRPQLEHITLQKLFHDADLLELSVVKELVEEDECRVPLTDERWSTVQNILVQTVSDHAKRIEEHCHDAIVQAQDRGFEIAKARWWEDWCKEWEEREKEIDNEMEEQGYNLDDSNYEFNRPYNPKYPEERPGELEDLEDDYDFGGFEEDYDFESFEEDPNSIPTSLLFAKSLFEQEINGVKKITSYADLLRRRATRPLLAGLDTESGDLGAWRNEDVSSSGEIFDIAVLLLGCLEISPRKEMVFMAACGKAFRCTRCYRGPASKGVSWAELVNYASVNRSTLFSDNFE